MFSSAGIFSQGTPHIFMTDNDLKERQLLHKLFPNARLLLWQFHMLKAVWAWLCDSHHHVDKSDKTGTIHGIQTSLICA